jgi:hypothetical protein
MATSHVDHNYRSKKGRVWTYCILGIVLIIGAVVANLAMKNPELAEKGITTIAGLPSWSFAAIAGVVGALLFWIGLKIETDWPEYTGAALISGALLGGEVLLGWQNFEIGGVAAIPYAIPALALIILLMVANAKTK